MLTNLRAALKTIPFVIAYFLSPSGEGLKVLIKTDITDIQSYKNCYIQLERWFDAHYNLKAAPNCHPLSQPCLFSYDPELYFNPNPTDFHYEFDSTIEMELRKPANNQSHTEKISYNPSYEQFMNKLNIAKNCLSDEEIIEILNYRFHASPIYYEEGHREKSIGIQAMTHNRTGISLDKA